MYASSLLSKLKLFNYEEKTLCNKMTSNCLSKKIKNYIIIMISSYLLIIIIRLYNFLELLSIKIKKVRIKQKCLAIPYRLGVSNQRYSKHIGIRLCSMVVVPLRHYSNLDYYMIISRSSFVWAPKCMWSSYIFLIHNWLRTCARGHGCL